MRRILIPVAVIVAGLALTPALHAIADAPVTTHGYIAMADGVDLRYTLVRPSVGGRYPILLTYNPYDAGYSVDWAPLLADGFALLGVNMRGTGCSGGQLKLLDPQQGVDGAAVVEWAAAQPWSNGHVGMFGQSYSGISQLLVAAHRPRGLDAIAPGHVVSDGYRDTAYPGGIRNVGFAAGWSFALQPKRSYSAAPNEIAAGDDECTRNVAEHNTPVDVFAPVAAAPFIDSPAFDWRGTSPDAGLAAIDVPVLSVRSWQDEEAGSRDSYLQETIRPDLLWTVQTNGSHGHPYWDLSFTQALLERFFLHYVKGEDNGWEMVPRHYVLHEVAGDQAGWTTSYDTWPPATSAWSLALHANGLLNTEVPGALEASDAYAYPLPSPSAPAPDVVSQDVTNASPGWQVPTSIAGSVVYTTPALARDIEVLGSSSVELWLASTALDTDVQVTLSELRPDGNEVYLQRGLLRASHRAEDADRSTALRPLHTDRRTDARPLVPRRPTKMRVELLPLDHVFRAGSAVRLTIDAPTGGIGDWILDYVKTPAVNTIVHDATHPSALKLPVVAGHAHTPYPACGYVNSEPCRRSTVPVSQGVLATPDGV